MVGPTNKATLQGFVHRQPKPDATVSTDEVAAYAGMRQSHKSVRHSAKEYVNGLAHTKRDGEPLGVPQRGFVGVYRQMSVKHLWRYVNEFTGRHNLRPLDTID